MKSMSIFASRLLSLLVLAILVTGAPSASFAAKKDKKPKEATAAAATVDINSADEKTIAALPGIGKKTAKEIVAGRPYKSADDLKRAKGMTDAKLKGISGKISFGTAAAPAAAAPQAVPAPAPAPRQKAAPVQKEEKQGKQASKLAPGQRVNINTAPKEELDKLPGIGPVKAQAIIESRPFGTPEDIMKVKGIKQKQFDQIKDMITVR